MQAAMEFYENFFGHKLVFPKYDMVFISEFMFGGMENAGLVTFNENLLTRKDWYIQYCATHELAHHWFGNLVTMKVNKK